jgi:glycosyltransferase involved in cell wall biosynthesis
LHVLIDSLDLGGAEGLIADFAVGAREAGVELSVAYLGGDGAAAARLREVGIEPVEVPVASLLGRAGRRAVREHVAEANPDLLHTHLTHADVLGGLAARSLGIPAVSTLHVAWWGGDPRERLRFRIAAGVRRRCAARVIAVSRAARDAYLAKRWDRPEHVVTVHNGITDGSRPGAGTSVRRELDIPPSDLVLGMVSVLRGWKGHEIAAGALERLVGRFPDLRLLIVGDGPRRNEIEAQTAALGDRVTFAGYRSDVTAVLDAVDVLVHPSTYDAFPTTLLEAMAAGVPAIATRVGGIPEAVVDGETGRLIEAPPTIEALVAALTPMLEDAALRRRMGAQARRRYESQFSVGRWLERLLPVYEQAVGWRPSRAAQQVP